MAVRYVDDTGVFLLPQPSEADPHNISGAVQQLLGAWLEVDLTQATVAGWAPATDRSGRTGFVRLAALRANRLLKNTRIGLFSWPSCVSRPPPPTTGHAVPTRGPATPAAGDQGHLASRFRNRTKL